MGAKRLTRGQAIKKYCKESCCSGSIVDWRECPAYGCILWRYRLGGEILGNSKSFTKTRAKALKLPKTSVLQDTSKVNKPEPNKEAEGLAEMSKEEEKKNE